MNEDRTILSLVSSSNYVIYNKEIARKLGIETAIILGELASEYDYYLKHNELQDGWFYSTTENIEKNTTLNYYYQKKAIDNLLKLGVLEQKLKGIPATRYFKFNVDNLSSLFNDNNFNNYNSSFSQSETKICNDLKTSYEMSEKQDVQSFKTNNNNININNKNNNNNINKYNIYSPAKAEQSLPYKEIVDYLNELAHTNYKHTTKKTKDLIKARFNEGFILDDFKIVIEKKVIEWYNDKTMNKYLRPETLFGTKFESYLNQREKEITTKDLAEFMDFSTF